MSDDKEKFDFSNNKNGTGKIKWFGLFGAIFWAFFIALALSNVLSPYFSQIINGLLTGIAPLLIGVVVAFIFYRLVDFTEKVILKNAFKKSPYKFALKRFISITIVMLIIVGLIFVLFSILVPKVIEVVRELTSGGGDGWDQTVNNVVNEICALIQRWFGAEVDQTSIKEFFTSIFNTLKETIFYIDSVLTLSVNIISGIFNFFIGLLLSILMLKDKEKITRFSKRFVYAHFKKEKADEICVMFNNSTKILFDYVICKLIEFAMLVVPLGIAFSILGLKFTWELAIIIGVFNFIPYFGIYIGAIPCILITLVFNGLNPALYMTIATLIITTIDFNILIPIITGNKLKVSALVVASSIIIGGAMFGIVGMLLAPPIASIISVVITGNIELKENRMKYVMELNSSREKSRQENREEMELLPKKPVETPTVESGSEEKQEKIEENIEEKKEEKEKKEVKKRTYTRKSPSKPKKSDGEQLKIEVKENKE